MKLLSFFKICWLFFLTAITEILYLQFFIKDCSLYLTLEKKQYYIIAGTSFNKVLWSVWELDDFARKGQNIN